MSVNSKLYMGNINADNIYMGESPVDAIYLGNDLVYSVGEPPVPVQPDDEIWYTTIDGETIELYDESAFNANLISNTYQGGKGVLRFDDVVTEIGGQAFMNCANLQTIKLPDSITSIGMFAFSDCFNLAEIVVESTTPCDLEPFAFDGSNDYPIYVPCESVNAYKTAWSDYADRIQCKDTPLQWIGNGIDSSTTQNVYFNTNYAPNNNTKIEIKYTTESTTGNNCIIGSVNTTNSRLVVYSQNRKVFFGSLGLDNNNGSNPYIQKLYINSSRLYNIVNGVETNGSTLWSGTDTYPLYIFGLNRQGSLDTSQLCNGITNIYYIVIKEGDSVVRSYVPVLHWNGTDYVPCFKDQIGGNYIYNLGTGTLTYSE